MTTLVCILNPATGSLITNRFDTVLDAARFIEDYADTLGLSVMSHSGFDVKSLVDADHKPQLVATLYQSE